MQIYCDNQNPSDSNSHYESCGLKPVIIPQKNCVTNDKTIDLFDDQRCRCARQNPYLFSPSMITMIHENDTI